MTKNQKIALFEGKRIRRHWDDEKELWYFSVVDVVAALTGQADHKKAQSYWTTLKSRLKDEGSEVVTKCDQLKMQASDGKYYLTDAADTENMLRLIQSIPNEITEAWAGLTTKQYKNLKGLKKENLRDNMTNLELVLNMLAETATTEISEKREPHSFDENKKVAREGGTIAGNARKEIETKTGRKIISRENFRTTRRKMLR